MKFRGQDILTARQFDKEGLFLLFREAREMEKAFASGKDLDILVGKYMATLFFEASTRTRFSFETAMMRLSGKVVSNADMKGTSSLRKFETLYDTAKVVSQMVDVIVVRHYEAGSLAEFAEGSDVPVINAGEGVEEHPTQGLLDLYTIWKEKGRIDGLTIGMVGDLKNSRVQHSQCTLLRYFDCKFVFVSPASLKMPDGFVDGLKNSGHKIEIDNDYEHAIAGMDVVSISRIQSERFKNEKEYKKYSGMYVLNGEMMEHAKKDAIILQPLPRVDEIAIEVDKDPRAKYFEQVRNGVAVRMALLKLVLA